ncbi:MAG: acyl-[ACP]--phospholipid O-acyltransferase [Hyphomicrobium sp. 32-62-53]|nr:MAG: acyl-[ACP]--phospholipid O-acyltransferase [Hyphomicrobium sp. 12-62-95]OYY00485.1 MAG: acyl-[ACP]--phospholipid O-acyltransferase [Hyphomicrobium sp. 32-62-53]
MFPDLLKTRRFASLFWCQFLSALNDNFVKNALVILILFKIGEAEGASLVALAGAVLVAPFFFLSALGGEWADKYDKAELAEWLKRFEIPIALVAAAGFWFNSVPVLFVALGGFGVMAALFGPIKYGILPSILDKKEISAGNALVESATFAAILIGTIAGGLMVHPEGTAWELPVAVVVLSVLCWVAARFIPKTGAAAPDLVITKNPLTSTFALINELREDRRLWTGGLITSWFWLVGAVALSLLPVMLKDGMNGTQGVITLGLLVFTVGIAVGSFLAAKASRMRPNMALVPVGAFLMAVACLDLAWTASGVVRAPEPLGVEGFLASFTGLRLASGLFVLSLAGGLFIVPAFAAVQLWARDDHKARVVAACNVLSAGFMVGASLILAALQWAGYSTAALFLILGVANLVVLGLVLKAWGKHGLKDLAMFLFKTFLRLEVKGMENLPAAGTRAIIAPNHVSFLDAALMHSIMPDFASYAIDTGIAQRWWVKPFLQLAKVHPIDPTKPLSTRHLINDVKGGDTLVIFPEGRLTTTGGLMKVYDGTAMIADKADAIVVPVRIDGLERSHFGYLNRYQTKKSWFPKTTVTILPPVKLPVDQTLRGKARRQAAGAALQDIMVNTAVLTANLDQTLFSALVEAKAARDTGKPAIEDALGTKLSYKKLILGAQVLGAKIAPLAPEGAAVGVLLPNAAGVAVTFFALQSIGRVAAMLNFSAGAQNMIYACQAAKVDVVLTSRAFVEKAKLGEAVEKLSAVVKIVYLEDVKAEIGTGDKIKGLLQGSKAQTQRRPDDPAAILFTSGSEGTPKGVVLSHKNLLANAFQCLHRIAVNGQDKVFNVMPVFHSFGLTGGLVMPLIGGVPVYLYPSPLHYRIVPELVYGSNSTIMFGTDTFLTGYARSAHPYDFHRIRLIVSGAEAVKDRTRQTYMEKFGVRILEGYGVTETAPVLAINTPLSNKSGTVGRLAPLMEARLEPVPGIEDGGRLYVRGPNVMLGYMRTENPGVLEPPAEGWHDTGDIVAIDAQGFITIKGRAKRFAKIAGEMVSLSAVEALSAELWPSLVTIVVSMPDARKGEKLVLLTTDKGIARDQFQRLVKAKGVSELNIPAEILVVDHIPLLGSGKPDYVSATKLVKETLAQRPAKPVALVEEPVVATGEPKSAA